MSQLNRNSAYLYEVDGLTVWEKLRNIRNFLGERKRVYEIAVRTQEYNVNNKSDDVVKEIENEVNKEFSKELLQDCLDEINFLTIFEKRLSVEAEKTRVPGKTDREMYEINYFNESIEKLVLKTQAEVYTLGTVTPATMESLLRLRPALDKVTEIGLLKNTLVNIPNLISHDSSKLIGVLPNE